MWRNWDCIVLYLPTINLRVNTWTIVPLASLSRPNGPWHVCCLEQHKYKSERWWIGPCYVDIDSRYKRVAVKLLQENRTQPWAVGCTEEARGRAAGINISEQEKTWLRREKQRGKGLKKDEEVEGEKRRLVGRERAQKGEMEGHLQRWHLIQHNLSHSGYCTVTYSSMLGLSEAKPLFLSLCLFLLWPFFYTNSLISVLLVLQVLWFVTVLFSPISCHCHHLALESLVMSRYT